MKYGQYVDANSDIFIKLFATPSSEMYWFSSKETLDLNIKVWDIANRQFLKENSSQTIEYQEQESKTAFIKRYFQELKEIPYNQSWNKFNASMKRETTFTKYKKWWSRSVQSIQILEEKANSWLISGQSYRGC